MASLPALHKKQSEVMDSKKRFILAISGVQGGKTTIGAAWLLEKIYDNYSKGIHGNYLIAAPTVKVLEQSTLPKFNEYFPDDWGVWKEKKQCFELNWGDKIFVRSTENPDHLEGMTILAAWLDEAGQMKYQVWPNVRARLSIHRGPCLFTTTPYSMGWFYRELVKPIMKGINQEFDLISWRSIDNPSFSKEEYDAAKASMNRAMFERRYNGKFTQLEGLVYPDFNDDCIVPAFEIPESWKKFAGMDFGKTNPTSVVCLALDPDGTYYVYKEYYKTDTFLKENANFIHSNELGYVYADPQAAQLIKELKYTYKVKNIFPANNDKELGIERVTALLKEDRLKIFDGKAPNLVDELETYHHATPDSDNFVKERPVDKHNHAVDALRYAFTKPLFGMYPQVKEQHRTRKQMYSNRIEQVNPFTGY